MVSRAGMCESSICEVVSFHLLQRAIYAPSVVKACALSFCTCARRENGAGYDFDYGDYESSESAGHDSAEGFTDSSDSRYTHIHTHTHAHTCTHLNVAHKYT